MRVLLLNPPSQGTVLRDYLCSKRTKSNHLHHPIDLLVLSGTLAEHHDVRALDATAEHLRPSTARRRVAALDPEVVVALVGSVSWPEDRAFLAGLAADGRRVLATGDLLHEGSEERLAAEPWIEAAPHVFANRDVLHYLAGERDRIEDMTVRGADGAPHRIARGEARARRGEYRVPRPRHELFTARGYRFSFARRQPFATVLTDFGCPYPCTFCVMGTLGFRTRPVADVLEEVDFLRGRGVHELFFLDQTFGVHRERARELCQAFAERGDLSWTAFTRPDTADAGLLAEMRTGGAHTLILGVESADEGILERYAKGTTKERVRAACARARALGLRTVGTFVLGLPEETEESLRATLAFALELELDFLSLNIAVPRFGTPFRARALELGLVRPDELSFDQSGAHVSMATRTLSRADVRRWKRRLNRRFYLRPSYLRRRVRAAAGAGELLRQAREGLALLGKNL